MSDTTNTFAIFNRRKLEWYFPEIVEKIMEITESRNKIYHIMILKWWCKLPSGVWVRVKWGLYAYSHHMYFKLHEFKRIKKGIIDL